MTDAPKTLALDSGEWKALVLDNLARAHTSVANAGHITPEGLAMFSAHLDRIKGVAMAWMASQAPAQPQQEAAPEPTPAAANGSAEPKKRRGGWPAGKPRKPRAQAGIVQ